MGTHDTCGTARTDETAHGYRSGRDSANSWMKDELWGTKRKKLGGAGWDELD